MQNMFASCSKLTSLDLSGWDTSQVTRMSSMFSNCTALETITYGEKFIHNPSASVSVMFTNCPAPKPTHFSWDGVF